MSRSTFGTVAIGLLIVFLALGVSGVFTPVSSSLARPASPDLGAASSASHPAALSGHPAALSSHSGPALALAHPDVGAAVTPYFNFTCDVTPAIEPYQYCQPQYWVNNSAAPIQVNTTGFGTLAPTTVLNVSLNGTLYTSPGHVPVSAFPIQTWENFTADNDTNTTFLLPITNLTLGLTWAQWIADNLGAFTLTANVSVNETTAIGVSTWYNASVTSNPFTLLSTTAVTVTNNFATFAPGTDPITGRPYEVAPFNLSFNATVTDAPAAKAGVTTTLNFTVYSNLGEAYSTSTYSTWAVPGVAGPVSGTTYHVSYQVSMANLSCGTLLACYNALNERPMVFQVVAIWNITTGTDVNNASYIAGANDTSNGGLGAAPGSFGGLEVLFGPAATTSYYTTFVNYETLPLNVTLNITSLNVPAATATAGWVTIRDVITGATLTTFTLNGTLPASIVGGIGLSGFGEVNFSLTDAVLGCAATSCYNIIPDPYNITSHVNFAWSVTPVLKISSHATSFITVPVTGVIVPASTGSVGTGDVTFSALVTGQYIAAVVLTVFSSTATSVPIFTSSLINATTGFGKTATWFAGVPGTYPVQVNITTDYAAVVSVKESLKVVLTAGPAFYNQTTYNNNTIFAGLTGAEAGTLLLIIGLIVGLIVALLIGRMMWGGRPPTTPAQPWEPKAGAAPNTCPVCGKSFDTPDALAAHSKSEHGAE